MKKINGNGYFIVVVLCAAVSVFLIARMVFLSFHDDRASRLRSEGGDRHPWGDTAPGSEAPGAPPAETEPPVKEIILTDEDMAGLIARRFSDGFPANDVELHFTEDGRLSLSAVVSKDGLKSFMKKKGVRLSASASLLLAVMPSNMEVYGDCGLSVEPESGLLNLTPGAIRVDDRELPADIIPAGLFDDISDALNSSLCDSGYYFTEIEFGDGFIRLLP